MCYDLFPTMKQTMPTAYFLSQSLPQYHNLATSTVLDANLLKHHATISYLLDVELSHPMTCRM